MTRFSVDLLDDVYFPRRGELVTLQWNGPRESLGADVNADRVSFDWTHARSRGRNTLHPLGRGRRARVGADETRCRTSTRSGGLFNLSGLSPDEISGPALRDRPHNLYRRIGSGQDGLFDVPTYLGVSLELGNVWQRRSDMSADSALVNGAAFLGFDTLPRPDLRRRRLRRGRRTQLLPAARPHPLTRLRPSRRLSRR